MPLALYAASKAAATMLTLQYAKAHPQIKFNALEPGTTATDMTAAFDIGRPVEESARVVVRRRGPPGRREESSASSLRSTRPLGRRMVDWCRSRAEFRAGLHDVDPHRQRPVCCSTQLPGWSAPSLPPMACSTTSVSVRGVTCPWTRGQAKPPPPCSRICSARSAGAVVRRDVAAFRQDVGG